MRHIDLDQMGAFVCQLREEERSAGTVEKYQRTWEPLLRGLPSGRSVGRRHLPGENTW